VTGTGGVFRIPDGRYSVDVLAGVGSTVADAGRVKPPANATKFLDDGRETMEPDDAAKKGAVLGGVVGGGIAGFLAWGGIVTLGFVLITAGGAIVGAVVVGYLAYKTAERLSK
jgi:hypothetical protein